MLTGGTRSATPNGAGASIDYTLTPGTYEFYFLNDAFTANDPGHYGLNLFFDGNNVNPGISAFSPSGVSSANGVPAGLATLSLNGDNNNQVSAPGSLSYTADGAVVSLTAYGFGPPGTFGGPPIDRVGNLNDAPDGDPDGVGFFDLTVTAVPEPSASAILSAAFLILFVHRFRCRHRVHVLARRSLKAFKFAAVLLVVILVWSLEGMAQTVQYVTLSPIPNPTNGVAPPVSLSVQTNQIISLVGYDWNNPVYIYGSGPSAYINLVPYNHNAANSPSVLSQIPQIFTGLTNIVVGNNSVYLGPGGAATFQITTPACANVVSNYIPADAIVIPASATGNVQIILESSADLVNWTAASPGTYSAASATNRFFRVRAVHN